MRFRITMSWSWRTAYQFHLENGSVVSVLRPPFLRQLTRNELKWTWLNNEEFILRTPLSRGTNCTSGWHIGSGERNLSSARLVFHGWKYYFIWELDNEVVNSGETRCRGFNVVRRQSDGKRLICWRFRPGCGRVVEGICRNSLPEEHLPVLLGMVLTEVTEVEYWDGSCSGD